MTDCITRPVVFSSLRRQKIQGDFDGGKITSDAGAFLLREVDRRLGLLDAINQCIPDPRDPRFTVHSQRSMLAQRIFAIALGYEDLNDHETLRDDPLFQTLAERTPDEESPLASPPTLCRLENRVTRKTLARMSDVFVQQFIDSHKTPPKRIILDFDATDDRIHGNQQKRFFHGYYDHYCFLPLYVFCGDKLLTAYLRPANIDAAKHTRPILKLLVRRLRNIWPNVEIILRGDSGFCRWKLLRWCERNDVHYILGLARNPVLERMAAKWIHQAKEQFEQTGSKQRIFAEITYGAQTWDRQRCVIVKAEHSNHGTNPRFVVTDLPGDSRALYEDLYCQRGDMENRIKEQQLGLFADRTSCHDFEANQFRVLLSAAAYVLMEALRRQGLKGTELERAQVSTIRLKLLKIGARVVCSVRRIVLHLAGGYPLKTLFCRVAARLMAPTSASLAFA